MKVEGPPDIGEFYYKGTARSIDDEKNYKALLGLSIPHGAVKMLVQDDHYDIICSQDHRFESRSQQSWRYSNAYIWRRWIIS